MSASKQKKIIIAGGLDPQLVSLMTDALEAPSRAASRPAKITAKSVVCSLQPLIRSLRDGTAAVCVGGPMSWHTIAERLHEIAPFSEDSLRKAWLDVTDHNSVRAQSKRKARPERNDVNCQSQAQNRQRNMPLSTYKIPTDPSGPLFDDD